MVDDTLMESDSLLASLATLPCPPLIHQGGEVKVFVLLTDLSETLEPQGGHLLPCLALHEILLGTREQPTIFHRCLPHI